MANFRPIDPSLRKRLWKHQRDALDFALARLSETTDPSLIRMPTGTGKTGVIACVTALSTAGWSLVLTPWANLRDQMIEHLREKFWKRLRVNAPARKVYQMLPSTANKILGEEPGIIVSTFAALNDLRSNYPGVYAKLRDSISLALVDEGHYEPAVEWGKSVKGLDAKTILLTATPYRNDLKLFRIVDTAKATFHYTHSQATKDGVIRELDFGTLPVVPTIDGLTKAFAGFWKSSKSELPSPNARAIVCCATAADIERAVVRLRALGLDAIGIHERFEGAAAKFLLKDVPNPASNAAEIWVHQHKLTEGLDDDRFSCVALFYRIRNDRKLIQQIGRVLRRGSSDRARPAVLLAPREYLPDTEWRAYREFEVDLRLLEPGHFREVVDKLLAAQPPVEYFEGRFRRRFLPGELASEPQVLIPPSVLVRALDRGFSLSQYIEDLTDTLNTEDAVILGPDLNGPCTRSENHALWVYASVRNAAALQDRSLYEITLESHCIVVDGDMAFISDSKGFLPAEYLEDYTRRLPPEVLSRFIDARFRLTQIGIVSSIPYDTVFRGQDLRGHNLLSIPASLTDRVHICRAARGTSNTGDRRYVGFNKGRLRNEIGSETRRAFDLREFLAWTGATAAILRSASERHQAFGRYMSIAVAPNAPVPRTMSLDLTGRSLSLRGGQACALQRSSYEFTRRDEDEVFACHLMVESEDPTDTAVELLGTYQSGKGRFWFKRGAGETVFLDDDDGVSRPLHEFLNRNQELVLIGIEGGNVVYQDRTFYKVDFSYASRVLSELIVRPANAPPISSEKGSKKEIAEMRRAKTSRFPKTSIFGAIADGTIDLPFNPEILICDDLGTESADFLAANFKTRQLALIHAKSGYGAKISASAFHEVVAQAMKNLVYLSQGQEIPAGVRSWYPKGRWNKTGVRRLYRAPAGLPTKERLWKKLREEIIGAAGASLHVILATSGCCDRDKIKLAASDPESRNSELAQLVHLLDGLNSYAKSFGVRLHVYELPTPVHESGSSRSPSK